VDPGSFHRRSWGAGYNTRHPLARESVLDAKPSNDENYFQVEKYSNLLLVEKE
jgi:hypothetical protein